MRKLFAILAVSALLFTVLPVSAHHGRKSGTSYTLCTVSDCNKTGNHRHNGVTYSGHHLNDGHNYHELCNVEGCTKNYVHSHDGTQCFPHSANDGHNYHSTGHRGNHH